MPHDTTPVLQDDDIIRALRLEIGDEVGPNTGRYPVTSRGQLIGHLQWSRGPLGERWSAKDARGRSVALASDHRGSPIHHVSRPGYAVAGLLRHRSVR